jgi:Bacterial antitoxin of type II TA system, VapB
MMHDYDMRTTLDIDVRLLDQVRREGGFASRKETLTEALKAMRRRLALSELAADLGKHPKAFKPGYDPEAGES